MRRLLLVLLCAFAWACGSQAAFAQDEGPPSTLGFNGSLGAQAALLVMDGEPRSVRVGQSVRGVKLLSLEEDRATVEMDGKKTVLRLGASPGRVGHAGGPSQARQIVLSAGMGGHFSGTASINGHATQFMVDTGATAVSMSQAEADRLGVRYRDGRRVMASTANGQAPAFLVMLDSVRVGEVEVRNVEALIVPSAMSQILLGNTFLNRFQMRRDNDILTLDLRY